MTDHGSFTHRPCERWDRGCACIACYAHAAARGERDRAIAIIEDNVPHNGYCSMNDCDGCDLINKLLELIRA